jgi:hypothetical protein
MSGATVSINKKWDDGTLVQIGGVGTTDFLQNLAQVVGSETADEIVASIAKSFTPASAGAPVAPPNYTQQAQQNIANALPNAQPYQPPAQQAPAGAPGPAPMGDNGKPKRWVPAGVSKKTSKPYQGFWAEDRDR